MGIIQQRAMRDIRARALAFAVKKHDEGCTNCAEGYIHLAYQHGATAHDIERAAMGRRSFLKLASAALATGIAADLLLPAQRARATQLAPGVQGYFGVDSCTSPLSGQAAGMPLQFYIGELGATQNGLTCFSVDTAQYVGAEYTHGYWGLCGPNLMTSAGVTDPAQYGALQAQAAIAACNTNAACGGKTIFADIETGFGGWGLPATQAQHAQMLDAFVETLANNGFVPGVYIADSEKDLYFPGEYTAIVPFVYWVAGGPYAGTMCSPCQQDCYTLGPVEAAWQQAVSQETFAGQQAILWQYWLSAFGCAGDFNYSPQSGQGIFTPGPIPVQ